MELQGALIDGAADPSPEQWGKTTVEERSQSGIGVWPGVIASVNPPNATLRLYGGAAFERVMHEFRCAAYSIECPSVSREKLLTIQGGIRKIYLQKTMHKKPHQVNQQKLEMRSEKVT
ncbi:hypothetical protein V8G54_022713 [Vigna mungo]|uniref:Uncharacterized protein n=1 Tax=Vigna mungo TaxID=3915 RepID=A0AAQ3RPM8_VIGMU